MCQDNRSFLFIADMTCGENYYVLRKMDPTQAIVTIEKDGGEEAVAYATLKKGEWRLSHFARASYFGASDSDIEKLFRQFVIEREDNTADWLKGLKS